MKAQAPAEGQRRRNRWWGYVFALSTTACALGTGNGDAGLDGGTGQGLDAGRLDRRDASVRVDAGMRDGFSLGDAPALDSSPRDGAPRIDAPFSGDAGSLSPSLSLPDPAGEPCDRPGGFGECDLTYICRFFSPSEGRCESCSPCGNLHAPCENSDECDILFVCYDGRCSNICELGLPVCGAVDCLDIGHPTHGVCPPP